MNRMIIYGYTCGGVVCGGVRAVRISLLSMCQPCQLWGGGCEWVGGVHLWGWRCETETEKEGGHKKMAADQLTSVLCSP